MNIVTEPATLSPATRRRPPGRLAAVGWIALRQLREAASDRWFLLYALGFLALALGLSLLTTAGGGYVGFGGFGRTAAGLVNLVMILVPLMGLSAGASAVAPEAERGTLGYLLAQPIGRLEVLFGKMLGQALALLGAIGLGFGPAGLVLAARGSGGDPSLFLAVVGWAYVLALAMLSVGLLVSVLARRASVAQGVALFLWAVFVLLGDLGLMGSALLLRLQAWDLLYAAIANPLHDFRLLAVLAFGSQLDALGPAGLFAVRTWGDALLPLLAGILAAWIALPAAAAALLFARKDVR